MGEQKVDVGYKAAYCPEIKSKVILLFKVSQLNATLISNLEINGKRRVIKNLIPSNVVSKNTLKRMIRNGGSNHGTYEDILTWLYQNLRYLYDFLDIKEVEIQGIMIGQEDFYKRKKPSDALFFKIDREGRYVFTEDTFEDYNNSDMITCILSQLESKKYINDKENKYEYA